MTPRRPLDVASGQMEPLARLPVFFALDGRPVVVAGDSAAVAWKAELLSAAGAEVAVFAPQPCAELLALAVRPPRGPVRICRRRWTDGELAGASLAVGGFDDEAGAHAFFDAAHRVGVPVNVIDRPAFCDFSFGAIVNRSPLVIGVSTDGAAPVFAQAIRAKLEAVLPQGFARWAAAALRWRPAIKAAGLSFAGRRTAWRLFTALALRQPDRTPVESDLTNLLDEVRGLGAAAEAGSVTLVGAGPGDPELLTLRAVRALQSADVILFDDLVSAAILDFARREARTILVGKAGHGPACRQDDINTLMIALARQGRRVVRLKGGDPLIFGRATDEIAACRRARIAVEIVPGITAAQGAAGRLGIPLTGRGKARRVQFVTGHAGNGRLPDDIDWQSIADGGATTAIYMPVRTLTSFVERAVAAGLARDTPAVAVVDATRASQRDIWAPIGNLPERVAAAGCKGPTVVMIGEIFSRSGPECQSPDGAAVTAVASSAGAARAS